MAIGSLASREFASSAPQSIVREVGKQALLAAAAVVFVGGLGGSLMLGSGSPAIRVQHPPLITSMRAKVAAVRSDVALLDAALTGRTPFLFGQSAPLRANFQQAETPLAATPQAPAQIRSQVAELPATPAVPENNIGDAAGPAVTPSLVEIPLPARRPAEFAARLAPPRTAAAAEPTPSGVAPEAKGLFERLFGSSEPKGPALAYANPQEGLIRAPSLAIDAAPSDATTAIYDISAKTVTLPNGTKLEAHSGLHDMLDDPGSVHVKMRGATPPATYDLTLREKSFHGVQALRLTPVGSSVYGRVGLLAHTFMLGPNGDSNGCVSFRNYEAFLQAYLSGQVRRLVVVAGRS